MHGIEQWQRPTPLLQLRSAALDRKRAEPDASTPRDSEGPGDAELMAAIAAGDPGALEQLYRRYASNVLGLCIGILRDRSEAEDALEDVFWELWSRPGRYDATRARPVGYLMTVARSRALDRRRRLVRQRRGSEALARLRLVDERGDAAREDPFLQAHWAQERQRMQHALEQLDPRQRSAVELSFFHGLSHSEIAEQLGDPLGTVKTRIRKGLLALRDATRSRRDEVDP